MAACDDERWEGLERLGRTLAAEQFHGSWTYEATVEDKIASARAQCKAEIGELILLALGICEHCTPHKELSHESWCPKNGR